MIEHSTIELLFLGCAFVSPRSIIILNRDGQDRTCRRKKGCHEGGRFARAWLDGVERNVLGSGDWHGHGIHWHKGGSWGKGETETPSFSLLVLFAPPLLLLLLLTIGVVVFYEKLGKDSSFSFCSTRTGHDSSFSSHFNKNGRKLL